MRWLDTEVRQAVPAVAEISLLRKAIDVRPKNPQLLASLGEAYLQTGNFQQAAQVFEQAAQDRRNFRAWALLALCYRKLGLPDAALDACDRGAGHNSDARIHFQRGCALREMRRFDEARRAFQSATELGDEYLHALKALLSPLAADPDGGKLLAFCDALPPRYRDTALIRAHRAIAFSRLGRTDEALQLVDLQRHVARIPFEPPTEFGGIERFNRILAREILTDPEPDPSPLEGFEITYSPRTHARPAMFALLAFMRGAMLDYIGQATERGLDAVMPPPPDAATLYSASLILRRDGSNGEHVHATGYVSTVYHVLIPQCITDARDHRGALVLGTCEQHTNGYTPCWGTRYVKPTAGWLALFPSHVFHDVVPSRTDEPRISVSSDLRPVTSGS